MAQPLTPERAIETYTELQRRVSVGAYLELEHDGSFPEDDGSPESTTLESLHNLEEWAARQDLEFCFEVSNGTWVLLPMSEETRTARPAAQEYQDTPRSGECVECGRPSSRLTENGYCEGCVMQAAIDAMEPEERWK